uniref:Uncharacterized protein n=1 Tax=Plectus sambesii TaxID=2011161 RepID=A0A914XS95_9BILA
MASKATVCVPQNDLKQQFGNQLTVPAAHVRRSSVGGRPTNVVWNDRLDNWKRQFGSSLSVYTSSLSLSYVGQSQGMHNLYSIMSRYSCCCGICNLKGTALAMGAWGTISALIAIGVYSAYIFNDSQYLKMTVFSVSVFKLLASFSLFIGVYAENHCLLIPFLIDCVVCMIGSIGIAMLLLVSSETGSHTQIFPLLAALSLAFVAVYLWFLVIVSMCFVLFRDKRRINLDAPPDESVSSQRCSENSPRRKPSALRVNSSYF